MRRAVFLALVLSLFLLVPRDQLPAAENAKTRQGLVGHYYSGRGEHPRDEFAVPRPPAGDMAGFRTRVDSRIAFGKDVGFADKANSRKWALDAAAVVIWKGYIRFPKAGTYYLVTVSDDSSAVYLNQARVCLNAYFGGEIPVTEFAFPAATQTDKKHNAAQGSYVVPIPIDKRLDWPIEVRYSAHNMGGGTGFGIDLYWVTPDAPKNAAGKPIAQLVPTEALYPAPPSTMPPQAVHAARCSISADYLYAPIASDEPITLRLRVLDNDGKPLAGRRVHVSGLVSYGQPDRITQPTKLTDDKGETTAAVLPTAGYATQHESRFYATVLDDMVDFAPVAHLRYEKVDLNFLPHTVAPYYDNKEFTVSPLPMRAGQPLTIKSRLKNRTKFDAEVWATFLASDWNIGAGAAAWQPIGEAKGLRLAPGEEKEISTTWTPPQKIGHQCFRIDIDGRYAPRNAGRSDRPLVQFVMHDDDDATDFLPIADTNPKPGAKLPKESRQRNIGPVAGFMDKLKQIGEGWEEVKKDIPLPGGAKLNTEDGRVHYDLKGPSVEVGGQEIASGSAHLDVGAAPGSDPKGDIVDANWNFKLKSPFGGKTVSGRTSVRISDKVQGDLDPYNNPNLPGGRQLARMEL